MRKTFIFKTVFSKNLFFKEKLLKSVELKMNDVELKTRINKKEVERNSCLVTTELKIAMQFTKLDKSTSKITNGCYSESLEGKINKMKNDLPNCKQLRDKTLLVDKSNAKKSPRLQTFVFSLILLQLVQVLGSG